MITERDILKLKESIEKESVLEQNIISIYNYGSNNNKFADTDLMCVVKDKFPKDNIVSFMRGVFPDKRLDILVYNKPIVSLKPLYSTRHEYILSIIVTMNKSSLIYGEPLKVSKPRGEALSNFMLMRLLKDILLYQRSLKEKAEFQNVSTAKHLLSLYLSAYCVEVMGSSDFVEKQSLIKNYAPHGKFSIRNQDLALLYGSLRFHSPPLESQIHDLFQFKLSEFFEVTSAIGIELIENLPMLIGRIQREDNPIDLSEEQRSLLSRSYHYTGLVGEQFQDKSFYLSRLFDKIEY